MLHSNIPFICRYFDQLWMYASAAALMSTIGTRLLESSSSKIILSLGIVTLNTSLILPIVSHP